MRWMMIPLFMGMMWGSGGVSVVVSDAVAKPPKRVRPKMKVKGCRTVHLPAVTHDGRTVAHSITDNCHGDGCYIDVVLLPVPSAGDIGRSLGSCEARYDGPRIDRAEAQQVRRLNRALRKEKWVAFDKAKPSICETQSVQNKAWTVRVRGRCFNTGIKRIVKEYEPECPLEWRLPNGQCQQTFRCRFENRIRVWWHAGLGVMYVEEFTNQTAKNCPPEEQDGEVMAAEYPTQRHTLTIHQEL